MKDIGIVDGDQISIDDVRIDDTGLANVTKNQENTMAKAEDDYNKTTEGVDQELKQRYIETEGSSPIADEEQEEN